MISFAAVLLTGRYVRRALRESDGTPRSVWQSMSQQTLVAGATLAMLDALALLCCCRDSLAPLEYVQCPTCNLKRNVMHVAFAPERHTTAEQWAVLDSARVVLHASGYN